MRNDGKQPNLGNKINRNDANCSITTANQFEIIELILEMIGNAKKWLKTAGRAKKLNAKWTEMT